MLHLHKFLRAANILVKYLQPRLQTGAAVLAGPSAPDSPDHLAVRQEAVMTAASPEPPQTEAFDVF